jgi:hypothetical protein
MGFRSRRIRRKVPSISQILKLMQSVAYELPKHPGFREVNVPDSFEQLQLICPICNQVCSGAMIPECGHHHCFRCTEVEVGKDFHCGRCKQLCPPLSWQSIEDPRNRILLQMYNRLQVECLACHEVVPRGYNGDRFNQHPCRIDCPFCR